METNQSTSVVSNNGVVIDKQKKNPNTMLIGIILLALFVSGGMGFGTWVMMDGKVKQLNSQIAALEQQNNELRDKINNSGNIINDGSISGDDINPIIQNQDSEILDHVFFASAGNPRIRILLDKGDLFKCSLESDEDRDDGWDTKECDLGNLGGKVYKVTSFGGTQEYDPYIGFIMVDGTVKYFSFYDAMNSGDYTLRTLALNGQVIDIVKITSGQKGATAGGYITSVFVLNDGTVMRFDESMVTQ